MFYPGRNRFSRLSVGLLATTAAGVALGAARVPARAAESTFPTFLATPLTQPRLVVTAAALNNGGQVVGRVDSSRGPVTAPFLWQDGTFTLLPTLGRDQVVASAISSTGEIGGAAATLSEKELHPLLWRDGGVFDLGLLSLAGTGQPVGLFGVNAARQIVGGAGHAFLRVGETTTDLGTLGGTGSVAYAINESGQVVGGADTAEGREHAFLWQNGVMQDLGTFGGERSIAYDINDAGQVVGGAQLPSGTWRPFLWENGEMHGLAAVPGYGYAVAHSINARGQVVGQARRAVNSTTGNVGVLWQEGEVRQLQLLIDGSRLWSLTEALDINSRGQVLAQGTYDRKFTSVLLTPESEDLTGSWTSFRMKCRGVRVPQCTVSGVLTVRNNGLRTFGVALIRFYVSKDALFGAGDQLLGERSAAILAPGRSTAIRFKVVLPAGFDTTGKRVIAVIDPDNAYLEEDEANNVVASSPLP